MQKVFPHVLLLLLALSNLAAAAGNNWMTSLTGSLLLSQFSIPGTHDSGARFDTGCHLYG